MSDDAAKPIDWRDLLRRYMAHVGYEEGATFIPTPYSDLEHFTAEEIAALEEMDRELLAANVASNTP